MYKFEEVYPWEVIQMLGKGSIVHVADHLTDEIYQLETMAVLEVFEFIHLAEREKERLHFYTRKAADSDV